MKTLYIYSSQFIRCPENPTQLIYLVLREEIPKGTYFYQFNGCVEVDDDEEFESYKYDGSSKFYIFPDGFVNSLLK